MESKTDTVKRLVANGEFQKALSLAKTFKRWKTIADKKAIQLASEIKANAGFYRQIGKDIDAEFNKGVDVLVREYGSA